MSSVAKIGAGGYRLFLGKNARLALTRLLADKPELSQGKALNQLIEAGLYQLGYLVDPAKCEHEYEWLPIERTLARRFACKRCFQRPKGALPKNITEYPGWIPSKPPEDIPADAVLRFADPNDLEPVEEEVV